MLMIFDRWQAADRDSPKTIEFDPKVELALHLDALLKTEGSYGTQESSVLESSGITVNRPRRWHKIFERMGLLYPDDQGVTQLTALGQSIKSAKENAGREFRRELAGKAISVLRRYQLLNPADITSSGSYPSDTDIHPYWAIWKAIVELDGKLHWEELNRELMWVLKHSDLDAAIARIRQARSETGYDPVLGGGQLTKLRERAYDQDTTTDNRDPAGQIRDQKTTPWFKRAGLGELLLIPPGRSGNGYWSVHEDVKDLLEEDTQDIPGFVNFTSPSEWFQFYGTLSSAKNTSTPTKEKYEHSQLWETILDRKNVLLYGPPGTGKTKAALDTLSHWADLNGTDSIFSVTFHPSYGYEDFILGYKPGKQDSNKFELEDGIFIKASHKARQLKKQNKNALLLIDEINRGDVARIFGELITYIEADKREIYCTLSQRQENPFSVPDNLYIIGTMNTADKSISLLDVALRRRFAFIEFAPDPSAFERVPSWASSISGISLRNILETLNSRLEDIGIHHDRSVGQALISVSAASENPINQLKRRFDFDIIPLISEYCHMDYSRMKTVLGGLIDKRGRPSTRSDTEFETALRAWIGANEQALTIDDMSDE